MFLRSSAGIRCRIYTGVLSLPSRCFALRAKEQSVQTWLTLETDKLHFDQEPDFLAPATARTKALWAKCESLLREEEKKGVLDIDTRTVSTITSHAPGYIDKPNELIVGLQTDAPLKRAIKPFGGLKTVQQACESYGYKLDPEVIDVFTKYRRTHNDGVFDVYTSEMLTCRKNAIMTGLPDAYGRGRLIGDYRKVALFGVDELIAQKIADKEELGPLMNQETMQLREEVSMQIVALKELKEMALSYGFDISGPASTAQEAIQWTYFAYLGAVKQQDGAAMSMGRLDLFLEHFFEADIENGTLTEEAAQELIDDFVIKLRLVRHLRTPAYNELFAGDPTWVTLVLGGAQGAGGSHMVTKTTYRFLQTLRNLGPAPEPNITVLWSRQLPETFKKFCAQVSVDTSSIQYENDDLMSSRFGSDYGIACCVSAMKLGKQMQFFGARCNLAKLLLYAINGGKDEVTGVQVGPAMEPVPEGPLSFEEISKRFDAYMVWLAATYANTMNSIHYSHDKYCYESLQMALHDTKIERYMAFGIAGISVVADSLSAIKYAKVTPIKDPKSGLYTDFSLEGDFPKYGNDDAKVDVLANAVLDRFDELLGQNHTYRNSKPTLSLLTITSNVVYGNKTGSTPDGRKMGEPFAPGANAMHGREESGALASLNSVAGLHYSHALDGISNTFSVVPSVLGKTDQARQDNLSSILDGYFAKGAHHVNVNVMQRETLLDAVEHPEKYPSLTIRVSGYAVRFIKLTRAQQMEVISRTFHDRM